jgi:hypothetical protein
MAAVMAAGAAIFTTWDACRVQTLIFKGFPFRSWVLAMPLTTASRDLGDLPKR